MSFHQIANNISTEDWISNLSPIQEFVWNSSNNAKKTDFWRKKEELQTNSYDIFQSSFQNPPYFKALAYHDGGWFLVTSFHLWPKTFLLKLFLLLKLLPLRDTRLNLNHVLMLSLSSYSQLCFPGQALFLAADPSWWNITRTCHISPIYDMNVFTKHQ